MWNFDDFSVDRLSIEARLKKVSDQLQKNKVGKLPEVPPAYPPIQRLPTFDPSKSENAYYQGQSFVIHWDICKTENQFYDNLGTGVMIKFALRGIRLGGASYGNYYAWNFYPKIGGRLYTEGWNHSGLSKDRFTLRDTGQSVYYPSTVIRGIEVLRSYGYGGGFTSLNVGSNCYSGTKHREGSYIDGINVSTSGQLTGGGGASRTKVVQDGAYFFRQEKEWRSSSYIRISLPQKSLSGNYGSSSYGNFATNSQSGWQGSYCYTSRPSSVSGYPIDFVRRVTS